MLSYDDIKQKADKSRISLVIDNEYSIYYIVLPKDNNTFDYKFATQFHECLDQIESDNLRYREEQSKFYEMELILAKNNNNETDSITESGKQIHKQQQQRSQTNLQNDKQLRIVKDKPAVMITLGLGTKIFSTGFNLDAIKKFEARIELPLIMQQLLARLLIFPMPTACLFNGHTIAGGLIFGLCHDFRIMREDKAFIQLSELNIGLGFMPGYAAVVKHQLNAEMMRLLIFGKRYKSQQALKMGVVQKLFKDEDDMINWAQIFGKKYSHLGENREAMKETKMNIHWQVHSILTSFNELNQDTLNSIKL
eukprot:403377371